MVNDDEVAMDAGIEEAEEEDVMDANDDIDQ